MSYAITVLTTSAGADYVSAYLFALGADGVTVEDPEEIRNALCGRPDIYWDYRDEVAVSSLGNTAKVIGSFIEKPADSTVDSLKDLLSGLAKSTDEDLGSLHIELVERVDSDWYSEWKKYYQPVQVGDIVIVPAWQDAPEAPTVVKINPCNAFGSGEHESTQMCLSLMQKIDLKGKQVIDVGCGSGILGIAAIKRGAEFAYFSDIDGDAMNNMRENAKINEIETFDARTEPLLANCPYQADVMFANLTADLLLMLSPEVLAHLPNGAYMIISGIIAEREEEVLSAYKALGLTDLLGIEMSDWRAHLLRR
ncbi:MAG: 50S ribosomal protein L11 methyltransferase [Clostridia bacterium]|nr:50S ribosomal protein L11 methyltransferase [Clostridia bacterium]